MTAFRIVALQPGSHRRHLANADTHDDAEKYAHAARVALAGHADVLIEPTCQAARDLDPDMPGAQCLTPAQSGSPFCPDHDRLDQAIATDNITTVARALSAFSPNQQLAADALGINLGGQAS